MTSVVIYLRQSCFWQDFFDGVLKGGHLKSDRLLSELMLLQGYGRLSTRELAERLEISERTAHRDMEALCVAGVPLIAHRGAQGGWELEKGWRTQVPGLDSAELEGLLMAQPGALGSGKLTAAAQRALDKLLAAMPAPARIQAESIRARLHFDPTGWRMGEEDLSMLPVVQDALARDRKLAFVYTRADGETSPRTVDPLGIVCKQMAWYLIARAPAGMRTYRVSRMRNAVVLAMGFERPARFDLAVHWKRSTADFKGQQRALTVTLALAPEATRIVKGWHSMAPVAKHPAAQGLPAEWQIFDVEFESTRYARFVVLGLGSGARTLWPEEFVREIACEITQMAAQ
jgi:predicted DNA-binding transcriptional regulator YafY